jgi:hypothetical protein
MDNFQGVETKYAALRDGERAVTHGLKDKEFLFFFSGLFPARASSADGVSPAKNINLR